MAVEVAVVERVLARLQASNPSFLLYIYELVGLTAIRSLWTWLALLVATLATLRRLLRRTRNSALQLTTCIAAAQVAEARPPLTEARCMSLSSFSSSYSSISSMEEGMEVEEERGEKEEEEGCSALHRMGFIDELGKDEDGECSSKVIEVFHGETATNSAVVRAWGEDKERLGIKEGTLFLWDARRGETTVERWRLTKNALGVVTRHGNEQTVFILGGEGEAVAAIDVRNGNWISGDDGEAWWIDDVVVTGTRSPSVTTWSRFGFWT